MVSPSGRWFGLFKKTIGVILLIEFTQTVIVFSIHPTANKLAAHVQEKRSMKEIKTSIGIVINGMGLVALLSQLGQWHAG
jgi:hypothetical protein